MTRGKRSKLHSAAGEKRIAAEEKGFRPLAHHGVRRLHGFRWLALALRTWIFRPVVRTAAFEVP